MKIQTLFFTMVLMVSCNQIDDYQEAFQISKHKTEIGENAEAIKLLNRIIRLSSNFDSAYAERGYNYYLLEKYDRALKDVNKAIELNFENIEAFFIRGLIYYELYDLDKALKDYTHIIKLGDSIYMNKALHQRAQIYYDYREIEEAIIDISESLEIDSLNYHALILRGLIRQRHNVYMEYKDTIKAIENNTTSDSSFLKYFIIMHTSALNEKIMFDTRGAICDFTKAVKIKPDYSEAYFYRAYVFEELGYLNEALIDYNRAIELDEISTYYNNRGLIHYHLHNSAQSLSDFNRAIKLDPKNGYAYSNRAGLKQDYLNDIKGAEKDLKKAKRLGVNF